MTKPLIVEQLAEAAYDARVAGGEAGVLGTGKTWEQLPDDARLHWRKLVDAAFTAYLDINRAERAYYDPRQVKRCCDYCQRPYNGPSVYCSFECALDDGAPWSAQPPLEV
jgi:hypothetical protein